MSWVCEVCGSRNRAQDASCQSCGALPPTPIVNSESSSPTSFLINPKNEPFLRGKAKRPKSLKNGGFGCVSIFMLPFVVVGLFIIALTAKELNDYQTLRDEGIVTTGTMHARSISTSDDDTTYYLSYSFSFRERRYDKTQSVSQKRYDAFERGGSIEVLFSPNNPELAKIADTNTPYMPIFLGIFSICWNAFILFFLYSGISTIRRNNKLMKKGQLINGELVDFSGKKDSDGDYQVKVTCRFVSPTTGETIVAERKYQSNALKNAPAPLNGATLSIMYVDDKLWEVL